MNTGPASGHNGGPVSGHNGGPASGHNGGPASGHMEVLRLVIMGLRTGLYIV